MKPKICLLILSWVLCMLYVSRAAPTITIGDSAELAAVGNTLGIGHSPGYPLYSILSSLGSRILPWANPAYKTNLQSAFWTAATVGLISWTLFEITGVLGVALLSLLLIGCGSMWMNQALVTEVFGLNSFLAAALLALALKGGEQRGYLAAYLLGLGLGNNHTLILLTPALAIAFWPDVRRQPLKTLSGLVLFFMAGLSVYVFIPIRAHRLPLMDWEEPATWNRFWKLFTRARYGSFQLAQGTVVPVSFSDGVDQVRYVASVLWQNNGPWCLLIFGALASAFSREKRSRIRILVVAFVCAGPLFFLWTHLHVTFRSRAILDRFMFLPLVPTAFLVGLGLHDLLKRLSLTRIPQAAAVLMLGLGGIAWASLQEIPYERNNFYIHDLGRDLLKETPPNTLLFADRADEAEFSLAYLQRTEGLRPDVTFIDCNAGVSRSIYGSNYYDVWGPPRLAIRTIEERARIAAWKGPVYYATREPQMIPIPREQEGLLFAITGRPPVRVRVPWHELLIFRRPSWVPGRPASWDRGLFGDYWNLLYQDSVRKHG